MNQKVLKVNSKKKILLFLKIYLQKKDQKSNFQLLDQVTLNQKLRAFNNLLIN